MRDRTSVVSLLVAVLLPVAMLAEQQQPMASAQQPGAPATPKPAPGPKSLKIVLIQGEGAKNSIKARTAAQPVVEVRDENDKPVVGAEVVFQLPATGPGGVFHDWMRSQTVRTNAQGQAGTSGFAPNDQEGRFNIKVTATMGAATESAVVAQSNVGGGGGTLTGKSKWWKPVLILGLGAAAGGGIYAAKHGGNGSTAAVTPANPVTITPGPISVGGPK